MGLLGDIEDRGKPLWLRSCPGEGHKGGDNPRLEYLMQVILQGDGESAIRQPEDFELLRHVGQNCWYFANGRPCFSIKAL
jgi:hypothetical protein